MKKEKKLSFKLKKKIIRIKFLLKKKKIYIYIYILFIRNYKISKKDLKKLKKLFHCFA